MFLHNGNKFACVPIKHSMIVGALSECEDGFAETVL